MIQKNPNVLPSKVFSDSAHGKVIISGEHSAVYGYPAVVAGTDLEITATLHANQDAKNNVTAEKMSVFLKNAVAIFQQIYHLPSQDFVWHITGQLPIGAGLGSSAAIAHALFKVLAKKNALSLTQNEYIKLVQLSEQFAHGRPSGLDAVGSVVGGLLRFQKINQELQHQPIPNIAFKKLPFFLINSGTPQESSKEMIEFVAQRAQSPRYQTTLQTIGNLTETLLADLNQNRFEPEILSANQAYLLELGIVSPPATNLIQKIRNHQGYAKITGAGGLTGGSGMIVAFHQDPEKFAALCQKQEWSYYQTNLGKL